MKKSLVFLVLLLLFFSSKSQTTLKVLFLGNSYTSVNDLPELISLVTKSAGDSLVYSSNVPGGYTFNQHSTNTTSLSLINQGGWDYVVLQEQSQLPSFTNAEVQSMVFPYATTLDNMIHAADSCTETIFYMTWGRKNGDASNCAVWPPVCTYEGMDSLLHLRYMMMAEDNNAEVSPVGAVWYYLRQNSPGIELYSSDESHPSPAGSYAAACTFYTSMFRESPVSITYDYTLAATDASIIRNAVKAVVFDSLAHWFNVDEIPVASFNTGNTGLLVNFTSTSVNAHHFNWSFGDSATSTEENPVQTYSTPGTYTVTLITEYCGLYDTASQIIAVAPVGIETHSAKVSFFPNPVRNILSISAENEISSITISDANGRIVLVKNLIRSQNVEVDLLSLEDGIYFVRVQTQTGNALQRIVKNSK
ncbi:MAG: hypothetical protein A2W93_14620 [Bacteroidetes bacterium GWF2_43_63]|nr:MAG: hypothetical protein A2W94_01190 [Bacteroidetes bacterium GWE2_42_42]OFY52574.1 MAG: hypothetical protein A2W93_14620 [Bacteroidetes bacterium GWF2_43_63]HBG71482.1 hypothetical protein [Bacteroidales bacterium]HCB60766.1 hypothetical protein [Bacteroidales bacterium]HCY23509.1 hypothetical protein [Bacteroidales bacterium]